MDIGEIVGWPNCHLDDRKIHQKKITRTDLEKRMLEGNLNWEYAKLYPRKDSEFMPKFTLTKQDSIV